MEGSKNSENQDTPISDKESILEHFKSEAVSGDHILGGGAPEPIPGEDPLLDDPTSIEGGNGNGNGNGNGTGTNFDGSN